MNRTVAILVAMLSVAIGWPSRAASTDPLAPAPAPKDKAEFTRTTPVTARITLEGKLREITLFARTLRRVAYTAEGGVTGPQQTIEVEKIDETYFPLAIEFGELNKAERAREWAKAIGILMPVIKPLLPYMDLRNNNAAQLALSLGDYGMREAERTVRAATTKEQEELARKKYEASYDILKQVARAEWSSIGTQARLKCIRCQIELGNAKQGRAEFEKIEEPEEGDAAVGLYWLVKAELDVQKNDFRGAMDGAVKSLVFDNKDVDTFPDALLLSARCYEEMQLWHRARDVYYEVARIFPKTDWADAGAKRLEFILDKGLTNEKEQLPIENVFFKFNEDVNKLSRNLLEARKKGEDLLEDASYKQDEFQKKDDKKEPEGGGGDGSEPPPDPGPPPSPPKAP
jgi:tetratricopeptide (TPR) repeat protein